MLAQAGIVVSPAEGTSALALVYLISCRCHVTALRTLGSDTSAGFTATVVMVLFRGLCRWPGDCGRVLGLRVAAPTVCAACFLLCFRVGDYWISGGVF